MSQVATPIQNGIGDGGLYTLFAGILAFACACNLLLMGAFSPFIWYINRTLTDVSLLQ